MRASFQDCRPDPQARQRPQTLIWIELWQSPASWMGLRKVVRSLGVEFVATNDVVRICTDRRPEFLAAVARLTEPEWSPNHLLSNGARTVRPIAFLAFLADLVQS